MSSEAERDLQVKLAHVERTAQRLAEARASSNGRLIAWCRSRLDTLVPELTEALADVIDAQELAKLPPIVDEDDGQDDDDEEDYPEDDEQ